MSIPRDVQEFLDNYPRNGDDRRLSANLGFYSNSQRCRPDDLLVEEIHEQWQGDYNKLERKHGFIQWLFPIREHGMNYESQPLQPHEITAMKADPRVLERLLASYRLMLDFYGMRLVSEETGAVDRSLPPRNYAARYQNLVQSSHNYLRISRILKCLSEFGFERLNAGFLLHLLNEQSEARELNMPGLRSSMDRWWANCIRNEEEREWVGGVITSVRQEEGYVFTREMYTAALEQRLRTGSFRSEDMKVEL
ncbi:opioid growth factor receptor conserved region-domain-containing protein [Mycena latifolia]|nr:opioid growth factor receptor conserved region-domain-containing protein [Mycena latifolia]